MRDWQEVIDLTWLYFYTAAGQVAERLGVSIGKAQQMLREACVSGDIRSKRMIFRDGEWLEEPTKPSEWAKDEIDIEWARQQGVTDTEATEWYNVNAETLTPEERRLLEAWEEAREMYKEKKEIFRRSWIEHCEARGDDPSPALELLEMEEDLGEPSGGPVGVFVNGDDFGHWLDNLKPVPQPKSAPARGKAPIVIDYLKEMFPNGVPDPARCPRKALLADLRAKDARLRSLDDDTLKKAIDTIRNDPK
jgi:hypothetical protein